MKQAIPGGCHPGRLQVPRFCSRQCTSAGSALEGRGWPLAPPAHGGNTNSPQWRTFSSMTSSNCFCATLEKLPFLPKGSCCGSNTHLQGLLVKRSLSSVPSSESRDMAPMSQCGPQFQKHQMMHLTSCYLEWTSFNSMRRNKT